MGTKPDLEIFALLAKQMGLDLGTEEPGDPAGPLSIEAEPRPELVRSAGDTLFTSGTLGRYSKALSSVREAPGALYRP